MFKINIFVRMGVLLQKVSLENVRFFSYHGFYPEEQVIGTEFFLNISVEFEVFGSGGDEISNTINYEQLFLIASEEMSNPRQLLESVAHCILDRIRHEFLTIQTIDVSIRKMRPPMGGEVGNSTVALKFKR